MDDRCEKERHEVKKNTKSPKNHQRGKTANHKRSDSHLLNQCPAEEQDDDCLGPTPTKKPKLDKRSSSTSSATREGLRSQTSKSPVLHKQAQSENKSSPMSTDSQPGRSAGTSTTQTTEQRKISKEQPKPTTEYTGSAASQSPTTNKKNKKAAQKSSVISTGTLTAASLTKRKIHKLRRKSTDSKSVVGTQNNNNEESGTAACSAVITGDSVSKVRRGAASQANHGPSTTGASSASLDTGLSALTNPPTTTRGSRSRANRHPRSASHAEPATSANNEPPATSTNTSEPSSVLTATHILERMLDQTSRSCPATPTADQTASTSNSAQNSNAHYYQTLQAFLAERSNMELPGGGGMSLFDAMSMRHILSRHSMMGSEAGKQVQQLIKGMQTAGDEGTQLTSVMEICQILVMGNEESLVGFPSKQVVPELIKLLQLRDNFEIMNHACRALTYMLDSLPRSSIYVVEAVPALLSKLQQIDCMDVAEQSLSALSTLSKRHGKRLLQQGSIQACLTYIDFFSIVAQRSALAVTANCCQQMNADDWNQVRDNLKILSDRLLQSDKKCIESACLAFTGLVNNYASDEKILKEIAAHEMLSNMLKLLMVTPSLLSSQMFTMVIHMIVVMCKRCPQLAVCLLRLNITETLVYLLCETPDQPTDLKSKRSPQEMFEIVSLIGELMPALPNTGIFSVDNLLSPPTVELKTVWQWCDDKNVWNSYSIADCQIIESAYESEEDEISISIGGRMYTLDFQLMQQINEETSNTRKVQRLTNKQAAQAQSKAKASAPPVVGDARAEVLAEQPALTNHFVRHLFGILYEIYSSSAGPAVRHRCLQALLRQIYFSTPELLEDILKEQPVSSHLMSMLGSQDMKIVVAALQMSDILIRKLPEIFHVKFHKHGVKYQVKHLSTSHEKKESTTANNTPTETPAAQSAPSTSSASAPVPVDEPDSKSKRWSRTRAQKLAKLSTSKPRAGTADDTQQPQRSTKHGAKAADRSKKSGGLMTAIRHLSRNPVPPPTENKPSTSQYQSYAAEQAHHRDKIKTWINSQAKSMVDEHFSIMSEAEKNAEHILSTLSQASAALATHNTKSVQPNISGSLSEVDALKKLAEIITTQDVSSFEIIHSGVIVSLLKYLAQDELNNIDDWSVREGRLRQFLNIFLSITTELQTFIPDPHCPLTCLLNKVMDCLHQQEQFQVKVHDLGLPGGSNGNVLRFFNTHQLTCQLERHPDCGSVKRWRDGPVKVDPLATVQAIERYLMIRGFAAPCSESDKKDSADPLTDPEEIDSDDELDDSVAAMVSAHTSGSHRLEILMGDHVLPYDMTVYQAVKNHAHMDVSDDQSDHSLGQTPVWKNTHTLWYRLADAPTQPNAQSPSSSKNKSETTSSSSKPKSGGKRKKEIVISSVITFNKSPLDQLLGNNHMMKASLTDVSADTLQLCRALHSINRFWGSVYNLTSYQPVIPAANFVSVKLTAKANRQLQDPLVIMTGNIPSWLPLVAATCPFLFPFETRQLLFYVCQFDRDRALMKLQGSGTEIMDSDQNSRVQTPRTEKTKVLITRTKLLEESEKLFNSHAHKKSLLEVSFDNEAGTGLGPTLEFYSLVSKELQNTSLQIWYDTNPPIQSGDRYVPSVNGLYPRPLAKNARAAVASKINKKFKLIGKLLAKSIMDSRILDLPLNPILYSWLLDQHSLLCEVDLQYFDESVARSYTHLTQLANHYETLNKKHHENISELKKVSAEVEDLCLDFTWPGQPHIHLKKGGKDELVSIDNLREYLNLLSRWILHEGIHRQAAALKEGFNSVFSSTQYLSKFFYPHEMEQLLCGHKSQPWTLKELMDSCRADHGFTLDSPTLHNLFTILSEYDTHNQRLFLMFVTGSPRLPVGGFKSLNPQLTIVRKGQDDSEERSDEALPSVMTCVNYLKLPMYSTIEIMREKLDTAINMGQLSFSLS